MATDAESGGEGSTMFPVAVAGEPLAEDCKTKKTAGTRAWGADGSDHATLRSVSISAKSTR